MPPFMRRDVSRRDRSSPATRQSRVSRRRRRPERLVASASAPALPRLRESSMCLLAARSAAACKRTSLSLPWPSSHRAPTPALLLLKRRMAVAFAAIFGAPFTDDQAQARVRVSTALRPRRSGTAQGVGAGRRPRPVQIDDSGRRGPFSGLQSFERLASAPACVRAGPVVGGRRSAVARSPCAHRFANPFPCPFRRNRAGMAAFAIRVGAESGEGVAAGAAESRPSVQRPARLGWQRDRRHGRQAGGHGVRRDHPRAVRADRAVHQHPADRVAGRGSGLRAAWLARGGHGVLERTDGPLGAHRVCRRDACDCRSRRLDLGDDRGGRGTHREGASIVWTPGPCELRLNRRRGDSRTLRGPPVAGIQALLRAPVVDGVNVSARREPGPVTWSG